jgi:hypothetical protein
MQKFLNKIPVIFFLIFIFLSLISFWGALIYRFYKLDGMGVIASILLSLVSIYLLYKIKPKTELKAFGGASIKPFLKLYLIFSLLVVASFVVLIFHQTSQPIISPWQVVPKYFFILYALTFLSLINLALKTPKQFNNLTILAISLFYFLSFSIALIIYRIGYGFDPFIHQATVSLIAKTGEVLPKPFYYLSQYSLETILHKIFFFNIVVLDKLLVPVIASATLPVFLYQSLIKIFKHSQAALLSIIALLILPFSFFIVTTPQNFAYFLLLLVIVKALTCENYFDLTLIYLFSLVALLSQPIAGLPALFLAVSITVFYSNLKTIKKKIIYLGIFVVSAAAIPFSFYINNKINNSTGLSLSFKPSNFLAELENIFYLRMPKDDNIILNFIYLLWFNLKILLSLIVAAGIGIAVKYKKDIRIFFIYLMLAAAILLSWVISLFFSFDFLINYERDNYSDRMLLVSIFMLLPFVFASLHLFFEKLLEQINKVKWPILIFMALLVTASLYLSYPRKDNYFDSHEYAVSLSDVEAVKWIEENKRSDDFIVLANQQVSVAALRAYGFKKYYKNNSVFYYPIPTGSALYQYFLDMVYKKPSRETMELAMDLAGVKDGYFVLNKYWWASPKIVDEAKLSADFWKSFNNGEVYVFGYKN